jgi:hypothetical protein
MHAIKVKVLSLKVLSPFSESVMGGEDQDQVARSSLHLSNIKYLRYENGRREKQHHLPCPRLAHIILISSIVPSLHWPSPTL